MSYMSLNPEQFAMYFQELEVFDTVILLLNIYHSKIIPWKKMLYAPRVYQELLIMVKNWKPKGLTIG